MHISVPNGALWDMEQVYSGIFELGQLIQNHNRLENKDIGWNTLYDSKVNWCVWVIGMRRRNSLGVL